MTCDLIHSKKVHERFKVQQELKNAVNVVNERYSKQILCPFTTVWGDSFQGALKSLDGFYQILDTFEQLISTEFRCGVGLGEISTEFSPNTLEMDGVAFHRSQDALSIAKKERVYAWIQSGNINFDKIVNTLLTLLYAVKSRWNAHQWEIIRLRQEGLTLEEIGNKKGISKQAVSKILKYTRSKAVFFAIETLNDLTNIFFEHFEDDL
ncbi:MAG: SatD family protein [Candidatus Thorarchaeota archaeon]